MAIAAVMVTPGLPGTKSRKNTIPRKWVFLKK
jgi:hypothetical protein